MSGLTTTATLSLPLVSESVLAVEALTLWNGRSYQQEEIFLLGNKIRKPNF